MTKDFSLVSVIMSNYNTSEAFLRAAIESILGQTYQNIEFVIIDDASTGNDVEIIQSYHDKRIILLKNESNRHISYSLNRGLAIAKGEYIARMDSDDVSLPRRIAKQVHFLQHRHDIDIVCAQAEIIGDRKGVFAIGLRNPEAMKTAVFFDCPIINPSVMFKASFLKENDIKYSTEKHYKAAEDYELWSRCIFTGKIYEYPQVLLQYRIHNKQISVSSRTTQIKNTSYIRKNMLSMLGIVPDSHEAKIHSVFCVESTSPDITLKETQDWALRLLEGNKRYGIFQAQYFRRIVVQHFFVIACKSILQKRASFRQVIKLRLATLMLSPIYYPGYVKRFLFSKRYNRHL